MQNFVVNTLFQEVTDHHNQEDGSWETQKLDPCWKLRPVACMVNTEWKLESEFWMKTTLNPGSEFHGSNKFVIDSNNNDTEVPEDLPEEQGSQLESEGFCMPNKGKSKTAKRKNCWSFTEHHSDEWKKVDWYKPGNYSFSAYDVSKKVIHLLRHSQKIQRENDGAVQFWRIQEHLQSQFPQIPSWAEDRWKSYLATGGGARRNISIVLMFQE